MAEEKAKEVQEEVVEETKTEPEEVKEDKEEKEVEVPKNLKKLVEEIENMKVVDLAKLVKVLEEKFGVSAIPVAAAAPMAAGAAPAGDAGEKSAFDVVLTGPGDKKINVIKAVKGITEKGLKDCKDLVDASASDAQVLKTAVSKEEAETMKKTIEEAGGSVELR